MVAGVGLFVAQGGRRASLGWRAAGTVRVQPANKKIKGCLLNSPSKEAIRDAKLNRRVLRTFWSLIELL
jgi:hypothetical protein